MGHSMVSNWGYNTFNHLLTNLPTGAVGSIASADFNWRQNGVLRRFKQKEFVSSNLLWPDGLAEYGWVYYPHACYDGVTKCKIHVYLHGCGAATELRDSDLSSIQTQFNWYSSSNNVILVQPQADMVFGRMGCFDFLDFWRPDIRTKDAPQLKAFKRMTERLTQPLFNEKYQHASGSFFDMSAIDQEKFMINETRVFSKILPIFNLIIQSLLGQLIFCTNGPSGFCFLS